MNVSKRTFPCTTAPPSDIALRYNKMAAGTVNISCSAHDVYPKPLIVLYATTPSYHRFIYLTCEVFQHSKPKLVFCSKQTLRLAETNHVICFSQPHGLFTTKYKFWFSMLKHLIAI